MLEVTTPTVNEDALDFCDSCGYELDRVNSILCDICQSEQEAREARDRWNAERWRKLSPRQRDAEIRDACRLAG